MYRLNAIKHLNPNSRQQIEWLITEYFKYEPGNEELFDDTGTRLKIDETTFKYIKNDTTKCPEELRNLAVLFEEQLTISKRLGQLAEGKHAWITHCTPEGFIHGSVNPNGAVTGRATHSRPSTRCQKSDRRMVKNVENCSVYLEVGINAE